MNKSWNTVMMLELDSVYKDDILKFINDVNVHNRMKRTHVIQQYIEHMNVNTIPYIQSIYDDGYGYKVIARSLGITYTTIRLLFKRLGIVVRTGYDVTTEKTRQFRSTRILGNKNPWHDWANTHPSMHKSSSRGIQGYYTKKDGTRVWLRSSWEYIYAKWLDNNGIKWSYEKKQYMLSDGTSYRPDFNILNDDGSLNHIVEIKGYYKNRVYKVDMMKNDYPHIKIDVITDIKQYIDKSYKMEMKEWKNITLSEQE